MKCSSAEVNGEWIDVQKDPITDNGKKSKAGRVELWKSGDNYQSAVFCPAGWTDRGFTWAAALQKVFENGKLYNEISFDKVRENSNR